MMMKIMTTMMMTRIRKRTIGARRHDVMRATVLRLSGVVYTYTEKNSNQRKFSFVSKLRRLVWPTRI